MAIRMEVIEVTPDMANEWLAKSTVNRQISEATVLEYACAMEAGQWHVTDQGISFGEDGSLFNGHHRLNAIILHGKPVKMTVFYGLPMEARGVQDSGRTRTLTDKLRMFRPDSTYHLQRSSYVSMCARLLTGGRPVIRTLDEFDNWYSLFKPGVEWAVETFGSGTKHLRVLRNGSVAGCLAFAHKRDPEKIGSLGSRLKDAITLGLAVDSPERTLHDFLHRVSAGTARTLGRDDMALPRKVLNAALAFMEGRRLGHLQDGDLGLKFFRAGYKSEKARDLAHPWMPHKGSTS